MLEILDTAAFKLKSNNIRMTRMEAAIRRPSAASPIPWRPNQGTAILEVSSFSIRRRF
jgi:hypothetical protein